MGRHGIAPGVSPAVASDSLANPPQRAVNGDKVLPAGRVEILHWSPWYSDSRTHAGSNVHIVDARNRHRSDLNAGILKA
jgi:hypothetical protein